MPTGQSALTLADLPFVYSFSNILLILITGNIELENIYIVGIIAGLFGTFLVILHPIQSLITKFWMKRYHQEAIYDIWHPEKVDVSTMKKFVIQPIPFMVAINTSSINFEKDKIAGLIYFTIILLTVAVALIVPTFQTALQIIDHTHILILEAIVFSMFLYVSYYWGRQLRSFGRKLKTHALYFALNGILFESRFRSDLDLIKRSIDQNDWNSADMLIRNTTSDAYNYINV